MAVFLFFFLNGTSQRSLNWIPGRLFLGDTFLGVSPEGKMPVFFYLTSHVKVTTPPQPPLHKADIPTTS